MVQDYIGCKIDVDVEKRSLKFTQPVLVQSLTDEFKDIPQRKSPLVPAKPGDILTKCEDSERLTPEMHTRYRTAVGKLLYLVKHSRPDIANAVRELARHCHCPTQPHWDAMCYCIFMCAGHLLVDWSYVQVVLGTVRTGHSLSRLGASQIQTMLLTQILEGA